MRRLLFPAFLCAGLLAGPLAGCVYYNGMYNANRLARSARKAEREGRTFDANNLWGQVATKAESVVVRHPTSKYATEAGILRGVALARVGECDQALGPLSRLGVISTGGDLTEDALISTGRCQIMVGNVAAADAAYSQVLQSKNADRRREARFQHARLMRQAGRYDEALSALADNRDPRAHTERILALAGVGRMPEALALADSVIAEGDTTHHWDSVVVALGSQNPSAASTLVDRVRRLPNQTGEAQARLLFEDGLRLTRVDTVRAARRFREAKAVGASGEAAGRASLALVRLDLTRVSQPDDLAPIIQNLNGLAARYPAASVEMAGLDTTIVEVQTATVSVTPETPQGDLRLFLAAELVRDSLQAPRLAHGILRRILELWPASPYAAKVVLAAQQLDSTWADSARALLEERYLDSPYLTMIRGDASPEYRQLEDSLGAFATSLSAARAAGARRKPTIRDDDRLGPRRRLQPGAGGSRITEPK